MQEGVELGSEISNIIKAVVLQENDDGTYLIREVDEDIGAHRYNTPLGHIDETFFVVNRN
jgi:hypothetical protein